ncbi:copper amine oxidase domain protein [Alkaliphilus metalliredigens QYMF]|uniref:Copper amine oxidase domain protein n=1 Tax=Alkaliphilus metalliredigens (strain QYMF) TaxID=293826 RepID=A6TX37_ALKMQ|nr:copper amine oxidase N-terminal domain-containing protein [Alkaliphilus metalliredigens]ABR50755.1 copper amine oxidase domain protein [Alkaliphilus metalliredigens QYMF]
MKKVLVLGAILAILASLSISSVFGAGSDIRVFLNDDYIDFPDAKPIIRNERTTVPVAIIARNLGIDYTWNGTTRTVAFEQDGKELDLRIEEHNSFIEGSRTYVPLRFIAESFEQEVDWRADVRTVVIGENVKNIQLPEPPKDGFIEPKIEIEMAESGWDPVYFRVTFEHKDKLAYMNSQDKYQAKIIFTSHPQFNSREYAWDKGYVFRLDGWQEADIFGSALARYENTRIGEEVDIEAGMRVEFDIYVENTTTGNSKKYSHHAIIPHMEWAN